MTKRIIRDTEKLVNEKLIAAKPITEEPITEEPITEEPITEEMTAEEPYPEIRSKMWIEKQGEVVFGQGRLVLFQAIAETGSIQQAAAKLGMSYRAAWGKIKATEERLGLALVEKHAGGQHKGTSLTDQGRQLVAAYSAFKHEANSAVDEVFKRHFAVLFNLDTEPEK